MKKFLNILLLSLHTVNLFSNTEQIFTHIFNHHGFGPSESVSGPGSNLHQTQEIRLALPKLIQEYRISSILDAPCGDFYWMRFVNLNTCKYIGVDIVKNLIEDNRKKYQSAMRAFVQIDIAAGKLPKVDLIICRDLLVHLPFTDIVKVIRNFKSSGSTYLLTTTFTGIQRNNIDISTGSWRPLNLELKPINLPRPICLINEKCTEQNGLFSDKCLGLWRLDQINI